MVTMFWVISPALRTAWESCRGPPAEWFLRSDGPVNKLIMNPLRESSFFSHSILFFRSQDGKAAIDARSRCELPVSFQDRMA